ncbi:MAG: hypothetical protein HQK81_13440 [Desulfovibrionaceae bacterium]|nr:hypothetical protein [Desulfovibrionaceae bacterium]MBF0515046.1 hypothetical protein [Desulfovibrionaceae bacterium]
MRAKVALSRKFANAAKLSLLCLALLLLAATSALAESVKVMDKAGIGKYLTDGEGMTLYSFTKDAPGKSACAGECLKKWPPLKAGKLKVQAGLKKADFGALKRDDGTAQATFKGYPLYYFIKDEAPGDIHGNGIAGVWMVVDPANFPPK